MRPVEACPLYRLGRLYSFEDFAALPEDTSLRYELQEGALVATPLPDKHHALALVELMGQLHEQLPEALYVLPPTEVHLDALPATVRVPDLVVLPAAALRRDTIVVAADILVAVEIVSPTTARTDSVVKRAEYADAAIPHYWLVDPEPPASARVHRLVDGAYLMTAVTGTFEVVEPCPLRIDLDALLR